MFCLKKTIYCIIIVYINRGYVLQSNNLIKLTKKIAFTLAEVLIVVGIIGIIAEVTIPTLMASFKKQVAVTQLKATYSILNAALTRAGVDYGTDINQWTIDNINSTTSFSQTYLLPYLKTVENCGTSNSATCAYDIYSLKNSAYYDTIRGGAGYYSFVLTNGALIAVTFWDDSSPIVGNDRFVIYIDVNARSKPNVVGKDVFLIEPGGNFGGDPNKNKLVPYGHSTSRTRNCYMTGTCEFDWSTSSCNKSTGNGDMCMALIMVDSWQMKDDYPW